jgi:hypothetical protein
MYLLAICPSRLCCRIAREEPAIKIAVVNHYSRKWRRRGL